MNKTDPELPDVNSLITEKLRAFPPDIADLAIEAIKLSEHLPEEAVAEILSTRLREIVRRQGGVR